MRTLLIANFLFEFAIGVLMLFAPGVLFPEVELDQFHKSLLRGFGIGALTVAMISIFILGSPGKDRAYFFGLILLILYHMGQTIVQTINAYQEQVPLPIAAVHAFFYLAFVFFFIKIRGKDQPKPKKKK